MAVWCAHNVFGKHGHQSRRRSMKQDQGTLQKLWKVITPMDGLFQPSCEGQAPFECVESNFLFNRCLPPRERRSSQTGAKNGQVGQRKEWASFWTWKGKGHIKFAVSCGPIFQLIPSRDVVDSPLKRNSRSLDVL